MTPMTEVKSQAGALYIVSNCCPVGCGVPVIVLQAVDSGRLVCYCDLCGCAWSSPKESQLEAGLEDVNSLAEIAPKGVRFASHDAIVAAGWQPMVVESSEDWFGSIEEVNAGIAKSDNS